MQLEVGVVVPGVQFTDPSMTMTEDEAAEEEKEISRLRVELRVDSSGGGDQEEAAGAAVLGPTVTVTRERRYRDMFDDGLLYKGKADCNRVLASTHGSGEKVKARDMYLFGVFSEAAAALRSFSAFRWARWP